MKRNFLIAVRLREVMLNGHWIANTNFCEQLGSICWQNAIEKVGDMNTIAALTYHINYYISGILNALNSGKLEIRDKFSFDFQPIDSQEKWEALVAEFLRNSESLSNKVNEMEDHALDNPFVDGKYGTILRNVEGVIEHGYYHIGQIVLLRKLIENKNKI